jgi:predicted lipoprotein
MIPRVWHRLNELHRGTALQDVLETPQWHKFDNTQAYIDFMHAHSARIHESE